MSKVFRLHVRPSGGLANVNAAFRHCLKRGVLGLGWALPNPSGRRLTWEEYLKAATVEHKGRKNLSRVEYLHGRVKPGDLIWARDRMGTYYLARVTGPWEYHDDQAAKDADIVNVVPCDIERVGVADEVSGKVVACFRPTRTVQAINEQTARWFSQLTWNELSERQDYAVRIDTPDLLALIGDVALEDLVLLQLQMDGWLTLGSSRQKDTLAYEMVLVHRESCERAVVQVKSGDTELTPSVWATFEGRVFLFQANSRYVGDFPPNVTAIDADGLRAFTRDNPRLLPAQVARWAEFVAGRAAANS